MQPIRFLKFISNQKKKSWVIMWQQATNNQIIGTQIKVDAYRKHLNKLRKTKSKLRIEQPWKPTFSLSKNKNKYYKTTMKQIDKENKSLLQRMIQIQGNQRFFSFNDIPSHIPSNKNTFAIIKQRERNFDQQKIEKQNMQMFKKIGRASSAYGRVSYNSEWKQITKYRHNISRKESVPDFYQLAKRYQRELSISRSRLYSRPQTALAS